MSPTKTSNKAKIDPNYGLPIDPTRRLSVVLFIEVVFSNPNGNPDTGNAPFMLPDGRGRISNACIKRIARDYWGARGRELFRARGGVMEDLMSGQTPKQLLSRFWDLRLFGGILTHALSEEGGRNIDKRAVGCFQLSDAFSIDPIHFVPWAGTGVSVYKAEAKPAKPAKGKAKKKDEEAVEADAEAVSDKDAKEGETGNFFNRDVVEFGLYRAAAQLNPFSAGQNGLTEQDLADFWEGLIEGWDYKRSSVRMGVNLRRIIVFEHPDTRGSEQGAWLDKRVVVTSPYDGHNVPASIEEYDISLNLEGLAPGVRVFQWADGVGSEITQAPVAAK